MAYLSALGVPLGDEDFAFPSPLGVVALGAEAIFSLFTDLALADLVLNTLVAAV